MSIELQNIDCNCNNCKFMIRDFETKKFWDNTETHKDQVNASHRINYGNCSKLNKPVSFIPNTCQLETQQCFENRRK
jgi:hypothetical protein